MTIQDTLTQIRLEARKRIESATTTVELEAIRNQFLGRRGRLNEMFKALNSLQSEEKREVGKIANEVRRELEELVQLQFERTENRERRARQVSEKLDVSLPGRLARSGRTHPLVDVMNSICDIFVGLGFEIVEGREVELDWYNFTALNIPPDHPVRDDHDSFYVTDEVLLRTETSAVQIHTMQTRRPPVRIVAPGRVYRRDAVDATHCHTFHQVEGLVLDGSTNFADLKGTLTYFTHQMFGPAARTRFRPHYFPFTEPSAEVDVTCVFCDGKGCAVCKGTGWIEVLGSGMVHPKVLENVGYDSDSVQGYAFGIGVERIAMLKYKINDIRLFFQNDMRFVTQF